MNSYDLEQLQWYAVLKMCGFAVNLYAADDFSVLYSTLESIFALKWQTFCMISMNFLDVIQCLDAKLGV